MGTNYFVVPNRPSVIEPVHIGKSSIGWKFLFEYQDEPWYEPPIIWNTYDEVKAWLKKNTVDSTDWIIMDEYDEVISYDAFIRMVERKQEQDADNPDNFTNSDNIGGYRFVEGWFR